MAATRRSPFVLLGACFFVSGATSLVYEVVWLRMLGLVFGHTVYALTTVLAAFMTGLGLGGVLFGRRAARIADPIRAYGVIAIGIGLSGALLPLSLWLGSSVYLRVSGLLSVSSAAFGFAQFLLVTTLLLVPTTLMGGTLPLLSQALARRDIAVGRTVGTLYAVNSFGAVIGVGLAGYLLLPAFGNRATLATAAVANVAVGAVAIWYARQRALRPEPAPPAAPARSKPAAAEPDLARPGLEPWLVMIALAVSGAISMIYEVAWTRGLTLVIGSSTYAFSAMLATVLVGMAGGAALYTWRGDAPRASTTSFALIQGGIGLGATVFLLAFDSLPQLFLGVLGSASGQNLEVAQLVISACALLVPALLIGAAFPCAVALSASTAARAGEDTGRLYAANTLGAIAGVVLAGFALVPRLGVHTTLKLGIIANLGLAVALVARGPRPITAWRWGILNGAALLTVIVLVSRAWDLPVMSSGPAIHAAGYIQQAQTAPMSTVLRAMEVLFSRDGPSATVSVTRSGQFLALRVNGNPEASNDPADTQNQLMMGHLPPLLHPDPKAALVIGLGSGTTAGAVARHPVERLDLVEIEPVVVEASRFFARENGDVLKDPRTRLVLADARTFLLTSPGRYDVIISHPSGPWIGGSGALFSLEFLRLARAHLLPGGLMAQWVPSYSLTTDDLKMIVRTFRTVFPNVSIWDIGPADYLLIGRSDPAPPIDLDLIRARYRDNAALRRDLVRMGVLDWPGVLGYFLLGGADVTRFAAGTELNTDDRLRLEFSAPLSLYVDTRAMNFSALKGARTAELPDLTPEGRREIDQPAARYAIGVTDLWRQVWDDALTQFRRALDLEPNHTAALLASGQASLRLGRPADALGVALNVLAREPRNVDALYLAGIASAGLKAPARAVEYLLQASALEPDNQELKVLLQRAQRAAASTAPTR